MRTINSFGASYLTVGRHRNQIYALRPYGEIANAARLRKSALGMFWIYLVFLKMIFAELWQSLNLVLIFTFL